MAHKTWNEIDDEIFNFENHICAFLDILGYKEKSKEFYSGRLNLYGRINRALTSAGVEQNRENSPDEIFTQIFSDSIIVQTKEKNIDNLLNYVASLVTYFSYEELYLRGGISTGKYLDIYEQNNNLSFFSSEALIKAYKLENEAIFPLIEIDTDIVDKIKNKNILTKFNNKNILNFARYSINEFGNNEKDVLSELDDIEALLNKTAETRVKEKIEWVLNYYLWFIEVSNDKFNGFNRSNFEKFQKYKNPNLTFG